MWWIVSFYGVYPKCIQSVSDTLQSVSDTLFDTLRPLEPKQPVFTLGGKRWRRLRVTKVTIWLQAVVLISVGGIPTFRRWHC